MRPFSPSNVKDSIFLVVDYVSKWVEAISTRANSYQEVFRFVMRYIFV